jgi:hypothetical protein
LNGVFEPAKILLGQFGFGETLDVLVVGALNVIGMEESVVPMLQLDAEGELLEVLTDFLELADDAQAVVDVPHVIIGHLKNEKGSWNGFDHALRCRKLMFAFSHYYDLKLTGFPVERQLNLIIRLDRQDSLRTQF